MISQSRDFAIGSDERLELNSDFQFTRSPDSVIHTEAQSSVPPWSHGAPECSRPAPLRTIGDCPLCDFQSRDHQAGVTKSTELGFHFTRSPDGPITRFSSLISQRHYRIHLRCPS